MKYLVLFLLVVSMEFSQAQEYVLNHDVAVQAGNEVVIALSQLIPLFKLGEMIAKAKANIPEWEKISGDYECLWMKIKKGSTDEEAVIAELERLQKRVTNQSGRNLLAYHITLIRDHEDRKLRRYLQLDEEQTTQLLNIEQAGF